jgi:CRISPR/Cas system CMR-associated protein Cmr3 (group 5 of RAMP superfamily)
MKCIKSKDGEIRRVLETEADQKVKSYGWTFVPKSEWKALRAKPKEKVVVAVDNNLSVEEKKLKRKKQDKQ